MTAAAASQSERFEEFSQICESEFSSRPNASKYRLRLENDEEHGEFLIHVLGPASATEKIPESEWDVEQAGHLLDRAIGKAEELYSQTSE